MSISVSEVRAFGAGGLPQQLVDVLNYALTLEYFEATFYKTANAAPSRKSPTFMAYRSDWSCNSTTFERSAVPL